jgi:hypothetical protein
LERLSPNLWRLCYGYIATPPKKLQDVIKDGYFIFPGLPLFYLSWGILTDPRKKRNIQSVNKLSLKKKKTHISQFNPTHGDC